MRIEVTARHIAEGVRKSCRSCPIALAVADSRTLAGAEDLVVFVNTGEVCCFRRGGAWSIGEDIEVCHGRLPPEVDEFIERFDEGKAVEPFGFDLEWDA